MARDNRSFAERRYGNRTVNRSASQPVSQLGTQPGNKLSKHPADQRGNPSTNQSLYQFGDGGQSTSPSDTQESPLDPAFRSACGFVASGEYELARDTLIEAILSQGAEQQIPLELQKIITSLNALAQETQG
jgi:hypothetical protein